MSFLNNLFMRLGIILAIALTLRGAGAVYQLFYPVAQSAAELPEPTMVVDIGEGRTATLPARLASASSLAAPLDVPEMQSALNIVRARSNGDLAAGEGAKMSFRSGSERIIISESNVSRINQEYERFKESIARAQQDAAAADMMNE